MNAEQTTLGVHRVGPGAMADRAVALITDALSQRTPQQVAVLARVNSALLPVQVALTDAGIGHTAPLDAHVLGRTGVRTALAYLRIGLDLERIQRDDLFDTINRPARKVKSAVQPLLKRRSRFSIGQLDQLVDLLDGTHQQRFADYLGDLRTLEDAITNGADTAECLAIVRHRIGLGEAMDALDASRTRPEGSSHSDDLDALEQLASRHRDPATFREWLTERLRVPADPHGVTLSTVHRVKGMEWPHVVVFAANQGLFPHRLADDVAEERRVFHVALTRCQQQVDVIADQARASPFVDELSRSAPQRDRRPDTTTRRLADPATPQMRDDGAVVAAIGVDVGLPGGLTGRIMRINRDHAEVWLHERAAGRPVTVRISYGQRVQIDGVSVLLARAPKPTRATTGTGRTNGASAANGAGRVATAGGNATRGGTLDDVSEDDLDPALFESLRAWRARVASEHGVPPYLVFHDRHLRLIAGKKPENLRELAACPGVGPAKLERYGDDVLDVVAAHP